MLHSAGLQKKSRTKDREKKFRYLPEKVGLWNQSNFMMLLIILIVTSRKFKTSLP